MDCGELWGVSHRRQSKQKGVFSMLCICEDTHVYCTVLRGNTEPGIFENETQKKWMLDVVVTVSDRMKLSVLSYCILDNELHLMVSGNSYEQMKDAVKLIRELYQKMFFKKVDFMRKKSVWRRVVIQEIPVEWKAIRKCVQMHMMPVKQNLVARPEDYWWCSYNDYLGRKWMPVTETTIVLSWVDGNRRKALKVFRMQHQHPKVKKQGS